MSSQGHIWSVSDILEATGGHLIRGNDAICFVGISTDSRTVQGGELFVALTGQKYDGHHFVRTAIKKGALGVLTQEGSSVAVKELHGVRTDRCWITVADTIRSLGDLAAFRRRHSRASVVAITGTNGKTTTKEMTASVLSEAFVVLKTPGNFNNLIGLPLTLFALRADHEWAVLELAMNRPGEIGRLAQICAPQVGVITNIGAGHLEGVKDMDGVMRAKGELLENLPGDGIAVLNFDDERVCRLAEHFNGSVISFGTDTSADVRATSLSREPKSSSFELGLHDDSIHVRLQMPGTGAVYNALAAAGVGYALGLSLGKIKRGLETVAALPGRMDVLQLAGDVWLLNDTYNANLGSLALAIETLRSAKGRGRGICVLGDMMELGNHGQSAHLELGKLVAEAGTELLYATGGFAKVVAEGAVAAGMDPRDVFVGSHEEIVDDLKDRLGCGDWVLVKGSRLMAMEKVVEGLQKETEQHNPNILNNVVLSLASKNKM